MLFTKVIEANKDSKQKQNILSHMISAANNEEGKPHLTMAEIMSNIFVLFLAGHETTSSALSWALIELAKNTAIQERMFQEISKVVGKDRIPTFDEIDSLIQVDNFISENLRHHPPAPSVSSRVTNVNLEYNGQIIPKGSLLGFNIYNIHHHPDHWKDPFTFNPDRFSAENTKGHHKFCYLPFSLGPRMCLGNTFSLIEQRLFLTRLLQKFQVSMPENHELCTTYASRGVGGPESTWVKLTLRD